MSTLMLSLPSVPPSAAVTMLGEVACWIFQPGQTFLHTDIVAALKTANLDVSLAGPEPDQLRAFFKWMSSSVKATSTKAVSPGRPVELPALPPNITIVP